jgi:DNA invertase Pin-like site-specific DNA recombinase
MQTTNEKIWNTALYVRLSKEDGDDARAESESITGQKALLTEYAKSKPEIRICSERADDGFSGVNFERPAFVEMMKDIRAGFIDCVIVKDLSRFGRNWTETGKYIEHIFPYLGIRFIAVNDNIDSLTPRTPSDNITVPFKNLINDAYCRDISIKTKSQLAAKCRKGDYIGSFAIYGYQKDEKNHNRLVIDDYAANIINDIFKWRMDGMSNQGIANRLNDMGVSSPLEYKRALGMDFHTSFKVHSKALWSAVAVGRILSNEVYIGVLEQGKRTTKSYKVRERVQNPKSEWIRVENNHEPIISMRDFETVSDLLKQDVRIAPTEENVYLFSGLLKCADCNNNMVRKSVTSGEKKYVYYVCAASKKDKSCSTHNIYESKLELAVYHTIKRHIESIADIEKILQFIETIPLQQLDIQKLDKQILTKKKELLLYRNRKTKLYEDLSDEIIDKKEYDRLKTEYSKRHDEAEQAIFKLNKDIEDILANRTKKSQWIEHFKQFQTIEALTRKLIVTLIDRIHVYEGNRIEIVFKYQYNYDRAVNFIEAVNGIIALPCENTVREEI